VLDRLAFDEKNKNKKSSKFDTVSRNNLKNKFTYIYIYGINNQDLKSLIKTLRLPLIITKEIQYADAILALANLVKNNRKIKQISHSKKITIHTIQSNSLLQLAKALRLLAKKNSLNPINKKTANVRVTEIIRREFITPLEETRLAIEEIVIAKNIPVDLFPRTTEVRKQQHELISHYQLAGVSIGKNKNRRVRIFPNSS
jgi:hypothetical protein